MPTILGEKFDRSFGGVPPGMSRVDNELWQRYRGGISNSCEAIYFNVFLGEGVDAGDNIEQKWREYWIRKTQLRADALLVYKDRVVIVEFRDRATASVVGRVLAYRALLLADNPFGRDVETEVVTNVYSQIVELICHQNKIKYELA